MWRPLLLGGQGITTKWTSALSKCTCTLMGRRQPHLDTDHACLSKDIPLLPSHLVRVQSFFYLKRVVSWDTEIFSASWKGRRSSGSRATSAAAAAAPPPIPGGSAPSTRPMQPAAFRGRVGGGACSGGEAELS
jgi:hypothetical protein